MQMPRVASLRQGLKPQAAKAGSADHGARHTHRLTLHMHMQEIYKDTKKNGFVCETKHRGLHGVVWCIQHTVVIDTVLSDDGLDMLKVS